MLRLEEALHLLLSLGLLRLLELTELVADLCVNERERAARERKKAERKKKKRRVGQC